MVKSSLKYIVICALYTTGRLTEDDIQNMKQEIDQLIMEDQGQLQPAAPKRLIGHNKKQKDFLQNSAPGNSSTSYQDPVLSLPPPRNN